MPRAPKKCGRAGCPVLVEGGRPYCDEHKRRPPSPSSLAARDSAERTRRKRVVAAWVAEHGWWCPGYDREVHESRDLTAAHGQPVARGGVDLAGVLCRSCNSRQLLKPHR